MIHKTTLRYSLNYRFGDSTPGDNYTANPIKPVGGCRGGGEAAFWAKAPSEEVNL